MPNEHDNVENIRLDFIKERMEERFDTAQERFDLKLDEVGKRLDRQNVAILGLVEKVGSLGILEERHKTVVELLDKLDIKVGVQNGRVGKLENYKWLIMGGTGLLVFLSRMFH